MTTSHHSQRGGSWSCVLHKLDECVRSITFAVHWVELGEVDIIFIHLSHCTSTQTREACNESVCGKSPM
jgi:hypothetical protein